MYQMRFFFFNKKITWLNYICHLKDYKRERESIMNIFKLKGINFMGACMVSNLHNKVTAVLCNTWLWLQLAIQAADGPWFSKFSCRRLSVLCLEGFDRQIMLVIFQCCMIIVREIASVRPNFSVYFTLLLFGRTYVI